MHRLQEFMARTLNANESEDYIGARATRWCSFRREGKKGGSAFVFMNEQRALERLDMRFHWNLRF